VSDDSSCKPKHVALCDTTLKCCVGRHIFIYETNNCRWQLQMQFFWSVNLL